LFFIASQSLFADVVKKKNILVLHSYHPGMTWVENINKAISENLETNLRDYVIYTEYMDTKRHFSKEYFESLKEIYSKKYKNTKFDMILSSDNNAFDFLVQNRDEIFGNVPVSFCGVNGFEKDMLKGISNISGVAEEFSDKETIETILKIHPDIKNIYIINDYLKTGLAWQKEMKKNLQSYQDKVNIIYSDNLTLEELRAKIKSFGDDTAVLLGVYYADKDNNYITYEKIGGYLLQNTKAPLYCLLNFNISDYVIGGKVIGGYSQGDSMSKIALRILNGEHADNIMVTSSEANRYIFNYDGLKKYNIDESVLPKDSKIINKPFSIYEEYKFVLFSLLAVSAVVLILFLFFLIFLKRKEKSAGKDELIVSFIRFAPIFFIPAVTIVVVSIFIYSANKNHEDIKKNEKDVYIEAMKELSKREVDRYIEFVRSRLSISDKNDLQEMEKIKKSILHVAQDTKFGKSGYIFIGSMDAYMLSHPNKALIGVYFFDGKHDKTKEVFLKFKEKIQKSGKGFVEYKWKNPNTGIVEDKITYVRLLPELNWYVASGVYLDEIDQFIDSKIKSSAVFDEKNINILIVSSIILLIFSLIISIILSIVINNVFKRYKKSILLEAQKAQEIQRSKQMFQQMANTDALTKVHNRLSIMNIFKDELSICMQQKKPLSVIMFDVDFFKNINDTYGHDVGDKVLVSLTKNINSHLRDNDCLGRYGGEEFLIIMPNTKLEVSKMVAERLRENIENYKFDEVGHITISLGVVQAQENESQSEILKRVDQLLYISKNNGRNKVSF
jgi:diguanylate cyclase (GGDEF)-like protein